MSAIREYYQFSTTVKSDTCKSEITNSDLRELIVRLREEQYAHLREQDLLLDIIRNQSKPQFWREVGANIVGDAFYDVFIHIGSKLLKL